MLENYPYMEADPDAGTMKLQEYDGSLLRETNLIFASNPAWTRPRHALTRVMTKPTSPPG